MDKSINSYLNIKERLVIDGENNSELVRQHISRYEFTKDFISNKKVLDIACGSGYGTATIKETGAASVLGVDISEESVRYAREHYSGSGVHYVIGSAEDLSAFGIFDIVISFETIEHLKHPEIFLTEVTRVLNHGGMFLISTPVRESGTLNDIPKNPYHLREWSRDEFKSLLQGYFHNVEIYGQYNYKKWFPYSRKLQRLFFRRFFPKYFDAVERFPLLKKPPSYAGFQFEMIYMLALCRTTIG